MGKLLMSDNQQSSPEEAIQISIKKQTSSKVLKEKKKVVKQPLKKKQQPVTSKKIQKLLQEKIEDEQLLKQLQDRPFNFGESVNQVIKITDKVNNRKKLPSLGISLVQSIKKEKRVATDYRGAILRQSMHLRKDMRNIRNLKKR